VRWIIRRDRRDRLRFAASDSPQVAELLARHGLASQFPSQPLSAIVVARDPGGPKERLLVRSEAVLALCKDLTQPWPVVGAVLGWIPRPLRDLGYRLIARWRYRIWGRLDICPLPKAGMGNRFL